MPTSALCPSRSSSMGTRSGKNITVGKLGMQIILAQLEEEEEEEEEEEVGWNVQGRCCVQNIKRKKGDSKTLAGLV